MGLFWEPNSLTYPKKKIIHEEWMSNFTKGIILKFVRVIIWIGNTILCDTYILCIYEGENLPMVILVASVRVSYVILKIQKLMLILKKWLDYMYYLCLTLLFNMTLPLHRGRWCTIVCRPSGSFVNTRKDVFP